MALAAAEKQHGKLDEDDAREGQGDVRGDRQCRPVLRRGHFPRDRLDPADPGFAGELRHPAYAVPAVGLGDPERDLRLPHPRRAAAVARSPAGAAANDQPPLALCARRGGVCGLRDSAVRAIETNGKRWGNAAFWGLLAASFWFGDFFGDIGNGLLVLALVGARRSDLHRPRHPSEPTSARSASTSRERFGNRLFLPALIIPFTAFVGTLLFNYTPLKAIGLYRSQGGDLVLLGFGVIIALADSSSGCGRRRRAAVEEGQPPDRLDRLGDGPAADARIARRHLRRGRRRHDDRRDRRRDYSARAASSLPCSSTRSAWSCSR